MRSQKKLIHSVDWNTLIILDACRYDYFLSVYSSYLGGNVEKARSKGSMTFEWLKRTWNGYYPDIEYVSGNAFTTKRIGQMLSVVEGNFRPNKTFSRVHNLWDGDIGSTLPSTVSEKIRKVRMQNPSKKIVGHFIQPHTPYLSFESENEVQEKVNTESPFPRSLIVIIARLIGGCNVQRIGRYLDMAKTGEIRAIADRFGKERLREAYMDNLKLVLEKVSNLCDKLPGKIVITSDHGELLGEEDLYSHPRFSRHPILRTVPWLEIH